MACGCAALLSISWPPVHGLLLQSRLAHPHDRCSRYRKLALACHPDADPTPAAHTQFVRACEAYDVLSNRESALALCFEAVSTCLRVTSPGGRLSNMQVAAKLWHAAHVWVASRGTSAGAALQCCNLQQPGHCGLNTLSAADFCRALCPGLQRKLETRIPKALPAL